MTRKELVDKALLKLSYDEAEGAFFALKLFSDALQAEADDSYADDEVELFLILVKQLANMNDAENHLSMFVKRHVYARYGNNRIESLAEKVYTGKEWSANSIYSYNVDGALHKLLFKQMALMWLKALKFDAMVGRFSQWQEEHKIQSQQALMIEQMLSSFKGLQSSNE